MLTYANYMVDIYIYIHSTNHNWHCLALSIWKNRETYPPAVKHGLLENPPLIIYSWLYQLYLSPWPGHGPEPVKVLNHGGSGQRIQCLVEFLDGLFVRRLPVVRGMLRSKGRLWVGWTRKVWGNLPLKLGEVNWSKFETHLKSHIIFWGYGSLINMQP